MRQNEIVQTILYNGFLHQQQNHLYIIVADQLLQQRTLYKWYIKLHTCQARTGMNVCNECATCLQVEHDNYVNNIVVRRVEEKKSIGIEAVADLQRIFKTTSHLAAERFFCIEEADILTLQAVNSVLKFLEEPQGQTIGFLFTTNEAKLLPTIRSRGQLLRLVPVADEEQTARVVKKITNKTRQEGAIFLLTHGYDEKMVLKQVPIMYELIHSFLVQLSAGVAPIVAQIGLEEFAKKTKTSTMILELLLHILGVYLKDEGERIAEPKIASFFAQYSGKIYMAAAHALEKKRYHVSASMLLTSFSLELSEQMRE